MKRWVWFTAFALSTALLAAAATAAPYPLSLVIIAAAALKGVTAYGMGREAARDD